MPSTWSRSALRCRPAPSPGWSAALTSSRQLIPACEARSSPAPSGHPALGNRPTGMRPPSRACLLPAAFREGSRLCWCPPAPQALPPRCGCTPALLPVKSPPKVLNEFLKGKPKEVSILLKHALYICCGGGCPSCRLSPRPSYFPSRVSPDRPLHQDQVLTPNLCQLTPGATQCGLQPPCPWNLPACR